MRHPGDEAIAAAYPESFVRVANDTGWGVENLSDEDFHVIASETLRRNLGDLYAKAQAQDGLGVDASANPEWSARLAAAGATQAQARGFAEALYPDLTPQQAVARYNRDLARAAGAKDVIEPTSPMFDRPY